MPILYAQPYAFDASGFHFESADQYTARAERTRTAYGEPVEEFEIQFIDGECLDAHLFDALSVNQSNLDGYFTVAADWTDDQKIRVIVAVGEAGYRFRLGEDEPDDLDIDLYAIDSLSDLAVQFVEDGLFGDIPKSIENYLDYDAIAHDLSMDYGTVTIAGTRYAYRAA